MRRILVVLVVTFVSMFVSTGLDAQQPRRRMPPPTGNAQSAEMAVKDAMARLIEEKKAIERDLKVLGHIRTADSALVDAMQPTIAVQKAFEEIAEAERLNGDFLLEQGLIRVRQALEEARRSPASANFEQLRSRIRDHALGPSSRVVVRNALRLQEETLAWMRVQELMAMHLKTLADITGDSLRASDQED